MNRLGKGIGPDDNIDLVGDNYLANNNFFFDLFHKDKGKDKNPFLDIFGNNPFDDPFFKDNPFSKDYIEAYDEEGNVHRIKKEDIIDAEFRVLPDKDESSAKPKTEKDGNYHIEQVCRRIAKAKAYEKRQERGLQRLFACAERKKKNRRHNINVKNKYVVLWKRKKRIRSKVRGLKGEKVKGKGTQVRKFNRGRSNRKKSPNFNENRENKIGYMQKKRDMSETGKAMRPVEEEKEWWIVLPKGMQHLHKQKQRGRRRRAVRTPKRIYLSLRRRVYRFTRKFRDRAYVKKNKKNMRRMFSALNVATYKQRLYMHSRWVSWLMGSTKYTMDNLNKYAGAVATVRAMMDRYFYKRITFANIVVKNTYMNTFLTLMFKGKRVIYQQTAGQIKVYRKIRHKTFVSFVLARTLVGLLDRLRRRNRFNIVHIDVRGIRLYNSRIHDKLCGYRRYLMKSLRYFNFIFTGLETKKARIILRIFPKPFKWTNIQQQHYNHIKGQCKYFASRYYHIGSIIRRAKKPFNGCRGLKLRSERSSQGLK